MSPTTLGQRVTQLAGLVVRARPRQGRLPDIETGWDGSVWKELLPDPPEARRISITADEFLDQLAREWVMDLLDKLRAADPGAPWLGSVADAFALFTAAQALIWLRRAAVRWEARRLGRARAGRRIGTGGDRPASPRPIFHRHQAIRFLPASAVLIDEDERLEVLIRPERLTPSEIEELPPGAHNASYIELILLTS